jgi:ribosomal protein S18 acetylase RimI-like enzyme
MARRATSPTRAIERAEPGDLVAMAQCMAIDADAFPYPSAQFGVRADGARVWVARDDAGRAVAFLAGRLRHGHLHVEGLAVVAEARRRGLGRALVRAAVEGSRAEGVRSIGLHVSVTNEGAVALYASEGFRVARRLRDFYGPRVYGGERAALEMRIDLAEGS